MSLSDLQDVCLAIGSIATLDLPMVVDLIGIYGLKGPYCTLTTTNWFLQALSVIPRGSWGDVSRRSYHDPLGSPEQPELKLSKSNNNANSGTQSSKLRTGSYELHQLCPTFMAQQTALNKAQAHQSLRKRYRMKRLNKRSPALPLLLKSESSTIGNRRR
ncbi:DNA-directed RNA polymerase V subunit 1 [Dorcoceras hygrometricum]|uniref:DNA-directed RNA polymerase V subunit 1 n=1 Tax=Dorcoceras hygrometricum TaxID=472368 RepID=A0A2Z7DE89_9LAMI|nr:DNA-directed RNA polymerase V subunit 1 [Dorcoceras hygrometricum]